MLSVGEEGVRSRSLHTTRGYECIRTASHSVWTALYSLDSSKCFVVVVAAQRRQCCKRRSHPCRVDPAAAALPHRIVIKFSSLSVCRAWRQRRLAADVGRHIFHARLKCDVYTAHKPPSFSNRYHAVNFSPRCALTFSVRQATPSNGPFWPTTLRMPSIFIFLVNMQLKLYISTTPFYVSRRTTQSEPPPPPRSALRGFVCNS